MAARGSGGPVGVDSAWGRAAGGVGHGLGSGGQSAAAAAAEAPLNASTVASTIFDSSASLPRPTMPEASGPVSGSTIR